MCCCKQIDGTKRTRSSKRRGAPSPGPNRRITRADAEALLGLDPSGMALDYHIFILYRIRARHVVDPHSTDTHQP